MMGNVIQLAEQDTSQATFLNLTVPFLMMNCWDGGRVVVMGNE